MHRIVSTGLRTCPSGYRSDFRVFTSDATISLVQGLRQLGWIDGQNLRIEVRWSGPDLTLKRIYAAQLIGLMPEVILVPWSSVVWP